MKIVQALLISSILLSFSTNGFAAKKISNLSSRFKKHTKDLSVITKQIYLIEKNLGKGNKRYLKTLKRRKKTEDIMISLEQKIKSENFEINKRNVVTQKRLNQVLVQSLSLRKTPSELLGQRYVTRLLKKELINLHRIKKTNIALIGRLKKAKQKYHELKQVESDLLRLMREMEDSKKLNSLRYVELNNKKNELKVKLKLKRIKKVNKKLSKKVARALIKERFSQPLGHIVDMEYGKKGITFKFDKRQPVKNTRAGKIAHTGSLSTYGNVVIVDHGNNLKSIFLGQFLPRVKKGQRVALGESLGSTFEITKNEGKLYFEVRKNNKPQNTALLLNKKITTTKTRRRKRI